MTKNNVITHIGDFKNRLLASNNGLKVTWFDTWHPTLDEALQTLPENESYPHELYCLLAKNQGPARKRIALVTEQGTPVAILGLRQRGRFSWEPVTQWITPGTVFPAKPEYILSAMESLGVEFWVAWWRMESGLPSSHLIRYVESAPTYKMRCSEDAEQYWRDNGYFKTIRRTRNRCKEFSIGINSPGAAEWTIKNWEAKWRKNPALIDPGLGDRILAATYLENQEKYYTITLSDQNIIIGGATLSVHQRDLVAGVLYVEPQYYSHGVGNRLIDLCFTFAVENGYESLDIGGGHEYKKNWAPQDGERWLFNICPEHLFRAKRVIDWTRMVRRKLTGR